MNKQASAEVLAVELRHRLVKDFLDLLVLQLVQTKPNWGYNIIKEIKAAFGVKLRHSALYPMLKTLEARHFIISKKQLKKGRIRKVYEITSDGKRLLQIYYSFLKDQCNKEPSKT